MSAPLTLLVAPLAILSVSSPAFACSCWPLPGYTISDYARRNAPVIAVPETSEDTTITDYDGYKSPGVLTHYRVLDDLGQDLPARVTAVSRPHDGASCGWTPPLGEAQVVVFRKFGDGKMSTGVCNSRPPLEPFLGYVATGQDAYVKYPDACRRETDEEFACEPGGIAIDRLEDRQAWRKRLEAVTLTGRPQGPR